jgi:sarcosine oxidase subunit delta
MQLFNCHFCGPRDQSEYTYLREAAAIPGLEAGTADWQQFVYERENPCGANTEWWQHTNGCRQILQIVRDTRTHTVLDICPARPAGTSS